MYGNTNTLSNVAIINLMAISMMITTAHRSRYCRTASSSSSSSRVAMVINTTSSRRSLTR